MGKITEEELQRINELKQQTTDLIYSLGELEYQKVSLDFLVEEVKGKIKQQKIGETQLLLDLKNKYGSVNINIETGEF